MWSLWITLAQRAEDVLEVHHKDGNHNNNAWPNLVLIHARCHDQTHRTLY